MWRRFEPYHAVTYFAPESAAAYQAVGLRGYWMGYFAGRAAPMGPVVPGVVTATFFNFAPTMVARSVPDAWTYASPAAVLEARLAGVDRALSRLLGADLSQPDLAEAAGLAEEAVRATDGAGRPMFAANASLEAPPEPHLRLWWATTCLREHRGDGHVTSLVQAEIDGCEAHVSFTATGAVPRQTLQANRGWSDEEWASAVERLRSRGWLDDRERLTEAGRTARQQLEDVTDRLAEEPWRQLGPKPTARLADLLLPLATIVLRSGDIPIPNPTGLVAP